MVANTLGMTAAANFDVVTATPWFRATRPTDRAADLTAVASLALSRNEGDEAIAALRMAVELVPTDIELRLRLGVLLCHHGKHVEAQDVFIEVLDRDPNNIDALLNLAQMCRAGRYFVEAIDLLEQARRIHGDHPDVLAALITVAVDLGDQQGATRLLVHLKRLAPAHADLEALVRRTAELRVRSRSQLAR
jgi:cytochrome c-type biogenesis protein CcmH/NrfG